MKMLNRLQPNKKPYTLVDLIVGGEEDTLKENIDAFKVGSWKTLSHCLKPNTVLLNPIENLVWKAINSIFGAVVSLINNSFRVYVY